jgi:signal transduction histidine kinase
VLATDSGQAAASLAIIEESSRATVDELHRLLVTLRDSNQDAASLAPASQGSSTLGIEQLHSLVAESASSGHPVDFQVIGTKRPVTALAGFTTYRVAQEALTNVRKHAGERAAVDMRLRYLDDGIELEISDAGIGRGIARATDTVAGGIAGGIAVAGTGMGLVGMRERILAVGGTLEAAPRARGGFLVRARIPEHKIAEHSIPEHNVPEHKVPEHNVADSLSPGTGVSA